MTNHVAKRLPGFYALALTMVYWAAPACVAAQADPPAASPVLLEGRVASKLLLNQIKPQYPPLARLNYIQGQVRMQVTVTRDGRVSKVHVLRGHPFLAASALEAIRRWIYRPFITRSGPAGFDTDVNINFALQRVNLEHLPPRAEEDLQRQIRPPQVLDKPPDDGAAKSSVRLRVLVSEKGRVIDSTPLEGQSSLFEAAEKDLRRWRFRPARWGNLPVPWYLDVNVPVSDWSAREVGAKPGAQQQ